MLPEAGEDKKKEEIRRSWSIGTGDVWTSGLRPGALAQKCMIRVTDDV